MPLKGEDKSKRAGPAKTIGTRTARRMPTLEGKEPERDCPAAQIATVALVVFLAFDFLFFFISQTRDERLISRGRNLTGRSSRTSTGD